MKLHKRRQRAEVKKKYEKPEIQFPTKMNVAENAYVRLEVKVPAMLAAIIRSECKFLGVGEEAFITNLIVHGIKNKEQNREQEFRKYLNERNKQNATNRVELQHSYEQLGSKS